MIVFERRPPWTKEVRCHYCNSLLFCDSDDLYLTTGYGEYDSPHVKCSVCGTEIGIEDVPRCIDLSCRYSAP